MKESVKIIGGSHSYVATFIKEGIKKCRSHQDLCDFFNSHMIMDNIITHSKTRNPLSEDALFWSQCWGALEHFEVNSEELEQIIKKHVI